uniref:hypothetical protein n=1 Tax=Thiocapsa sp. TaxID=2024551 RepID=UPI0025CDD16F
MTLRRRAQLIALVSALVFLALLGLLLVNHRDWSQSARSLALTNTLNVDVIQLRTALFGYFLRAQDYSRAPVESQFETIVDLLTR